jgi:hypothetical protein
MAERNNMEGVLQEEVIHGAQFIAPAQTKSKYYILLPRNTYVILS